MDADRESKVEIAMVVGYVVWHTSTEAVHTGRAYASEADAEKVRNAAVWHTRSSLVVKPVRFA